MKRTKLSFKKALVCLLCVTLALCLAGCGSGKKKSELNPKSPVTVTVWNYYNGDQQAAFDQLVDEFNSSIGAEKGVVVISVSQGNIDTLADSLIASVKGEAGAQETPSIAAVYSETAYVLDEAGALAPMDSYFTEAELKEYIPGFLEEGRFNANNELMLFPISKSTELFTANETDWAAFAQATGIELSSITTKEKLTAAAKAYYEWTDSLTPTPEDGKALYGRDSVSNYVYIGTYQLGHEMFKVKDGKLSVDLDKTTFKTLWDNYYIPYINGYFGAYAKFRSEDCKTGKILALTSSSSSVGYLPTAVTAADDTSHNIETFIGADLPFENAANDASVQQGASYCLLKSTPAQQEGSIEFLKWFTESERNLDFATMSGYSPVTFAANNADAIKSAFGSNVSTPKAQNTLDALLIDADIFSNHEAYASKPFEGCKEVRSRLGSLFEKTAATDRAAVAEAIAAGSSRADAVAKYSSDEYFETFYANLVEQVNALVVE